MYIKKSFIILGLIIMTGVYYAATSRNTRKAPSDFKDAPISDQLDGSFFGGGSGRIPEQLNDSRIPIPATPQKQEKSKADVSKPFIAVEMKSAPIAGATPQETRANVDAFFKKGYFKIDQ